MNKKDLNEFLTGQWIIFFNVTLNGTDTRFYFKKYYQTIQRPSFSLTKFCLFNDIIECNKVLDKIMKYISQYGLMVPDTVHHCFKHLEPSLIQLKVGKLQDS